MARTSLTTTTELISEYDLYLFGEGNHTRIYQKLGAHIVTVDGVQGVHFAVWAPNADRVSVVGDFNAWDGRRDRLGLLGASGVWAAFVPGAWFIAMGAAATHLGLARRALDEARDGLRGKTDRYTNRVLLDNDAIQQRLEAAEGLWFACRAGMREALKDIWEAAMRGEPPSTEMRLTARVAADTATDKGAEIVREAYDVAGASAIHRGSVMQRLLREASCLTHHVSAKRASYEVTGRVRCGIERLSFRV